MVTQLAARRVVTPEGVLDDVTLSIADGRLVGLAPGLAADAERIDGWVVPGFVDTHCHGAAGFDFANPDATGVRAAIDHHRSHGTTTLFASTVTESIPDLLDQIGRLRGFVAAGEIDGVHLEGPFLAPGKKGAHNVELLIAPTADVVAKIINASGSDVRMITIAPELDHGLEAVRSFAAAGVQPAFGHSDADAPTTKAAIEAGSRVATHLFNAMCPIHHREPGPVPALLTDERVVVELICDGTHLAADVIRLAIEAASVDRVALVTDAMSATGQSDGDYQLGTLAVQVRSGVARLATSDGTPGAIAGSTLTMDRAVEFVVNEVGCSIAEASTMASTTPAAAHGLADVGIIEVGRRADLCILDDEARTIGVLRRGDWVRRDWA